MLTARDEDIDKILGLELGAEHYLTKPFNPRELVAGQSHFATRRTLRNRWPAPSAWRFDNRRGEREVRVASRTLDLRTQEFDLLLTLAEHRGLLLSPSKSCKKPGASTFTAKRAQ